MNKGKRFIVSFVEVIIGAVLSVCGYLGMIDDYWSGMGSALVIVGFIMLVRQYRYKTNVEYKEKVDINVNDERNKYLRVKAWASAGYLFVIIGAIGSIIFKIFGFDTYSLFAGASICLIMLLYWICYFVLMRKF